MKNWREQFRKGKRKRKMWNWKTQTKELQGVFQTEGKMEGGLVGHNWEWEDMKVESAMDRSSMVLY